jgi:hypothetical protein
MSSNLDVKSPVFTSGPSRILPDPLETSLNDSPPDAVVSRKNLFASPLAPNARRRGFVRNLAEQYVGQVQPFAAIDVSLNRL